MGDRVFIRVVAANLEKRQLDYEWVLKPDDETELPKKRERRKKKKE
jgi:ribonuclease R